MAPVVMRRREDIVANHIHFSNTPGTIRVSNTDDTSSESELSSIVGASDVTDLGDLVKLCKHKKKEEWRPKGSQRNKHCL